MNAHWGVGGTRAALMVLAGLLTAFGTDVYGWSVSGIVKNTSSAPISSVAVTVKDSSKYSTVTDADGKFSLESPVSIDFGVNNTDHPAPYSIRLAGNDLLIEHAPEGTLELTLMDCSGRAIRSAKAAPAKGVASIGMPRGLAGGILFLRMKTATREDFYTLVSAANRLLVKTSQSPLKTGDATIAAAASYPTLLFKKTDYRDTSITMTSEKMTDVAVVMTSAGQTCALPTGTLKWQSTGILVNIKPDAGHQIASVKDPTIQKYNGKYLIYCTVFNKTTNAFNMQFIQFADFAKAKDETPYFMDQTSGFDGYKCAPELFYFEPQKLWYLIWQQQEPAYSTTTTPDDPKSWSAPKRFASNWDSWKAVVKGQYGAIDYWPIADDKNFYIYCTGDDGSVYRSKTTLANFPGGFSALEIVKRFSGTDVIFEGGSHYKVKGTANTYLHVIEGQGSTGRYFSAWTSEGIEGEWKDYKVGQSNAFIRSTNVTYASGVTDWSDDVSHGEFIRDNPNQLMELDPCNLQFLYQGKAPNSGGDYNLLPYRLGLVTLQ